MPPCRRKMSAPFVRTHLASKPLNSPLSGGSGRVEDVELARGVCAPASSGAKASWVVKPAVTAATKCLRSTGSFNLEFFTALSISCRCVKKSGRGCHRRRRFPRDSNRRKALCGRLLFPYFLAGSSARRPTANFKSSYRRRQLLKVHPLKQDAGLSDDCAGLPDFNIIGDPVVQLRYRGKPDDRRSRPLMPNWVVPPNGVDHVGLPSGGRRNPLRMWRAKVVELHGVPDHGRSKYDLPERSRACVIFCRFSDLRPAVRSAEALAARIGPCLRRQSGTPLPFSLRGDGAASGPRADRE